MDSVLEGIPLTEESTATILLFYCQSVLVSDSSRDGSVVCFVQQEDRDSLAENREINNLMKTGRSR